jgi:uncharacterized protein (DUF2384 family)
MIQIILSAAKERIPTMTDGELAAACSEVMRLQNFEMLNVVNPDDVAELFSLLGVEVEKRRLISDKTWLRRKTDRF